jgi:hypothetical protein
MLKLAKKEVEVKSNRKKERRESPGIKINPRIAACQESLGCHPGAKRALGNRNTHALI